MNSMKNRRVILPSPLVRRAAGMIKRRAASHGATAVRVFGSHAEGRAGPRSDLDLLVRFAPGRDLFDLIGLQQDLEDRLGCPVDVVSERGLSPFLKEHILAQARPL
jgi:hypothetical protein